MRRFISVITLFVMIAAAGSAVAQVRGKARLQGVVTDKATSKPVGDAKVTISPADGTTQPIVTKTNAKGRWSALGLTGGQWHIDIEAAGFTTSRGSVNVSELQMVPAITTQLVAAVVEEPTVAPTGPSIPQEAIDAVNAGQTLMAEGKFKEAVVELEKALPHLPDNLQLKQVLAQAYYKTGDLPKAIAMLEVVTAADATNSGVALLLTNLYLENGQLDKGRATLQAIPPAAITEPTVYLNIGILFLNKENPADAATYFTRAIEMDAARAEGYYYRGMANLQLKKNAEAKADFEKVLSIAPDSPEGRDSKQLLAGLK